MDLQRRADGLTVAGVEGMVVLFAVTLEGAVVTSE